MSQFLEKAECAICKDALDQTDIILTNPCGHLLCVGCSCQLSRMWQDGAETELRCPICRTILLEHKFTKAYSIRSSKMSTTSLFTWVPTSMYMNTSYDQLLIEALTNRDLEMAFGCAFFLGKSYDSSSVGYILPATSQQLNMRLLQNRPTINKGFYELLLSLLLYNMLSTNIR